MKKIKAKHIQKFIKSAKGKSATRPRTYELPFHLNSYVLDQIIVHAIFKSPEQESINKVKLYVEHDGCDVGIFIYHRGKCVWQRELDQEEIELLVHEGDLDNCFHFSEIINRLISFTGPVVSELLYSEAAFSDWFDTGFDPETLEEFANTFQESILDGNVVYFEEGDDYFKKFLHSLYE